jgi:hypothetical protein
MEMFDGFEGFEDFGEDDFVDVFHIDMGIDDVRLMYDCIIRRIDSWEGYPKRPLGEQADLTRLRDLFFAMILEHNFNVESE